MADVAQSIDYGNDAEYQKELRKRLMERMQQQERGLESDTVLGRESARGDSQSSREIGLMNAINKSAAQFGSIGGRIADTSASDDFTKSLMGSQQQMSQDLRSSRGDRDKLNQYLMGKLLDQEGKVAEGRQKQEKIASEEKIAGQKLAAEREADARKKAEKDAEIKSGKQVPGSVAAEIGEFDSALSMADGVMDSYNKKASSFGSSISSYLPGTDADQYEKERNVAAQAIGTVLEGGKLTDFDYARYKSMLPSPSDTNEIAKTKIAAMKNLISQKREGKISGLEQTGFEVSGVQRVRPDGFRNASSGTATAGTKKQAQLGPNQMRVTNGQETRIIDRSDMVEALKDGYREVK